MNERLMQRVKALVDGPPKQRWRFELGRFPRDCKIFLNDEPWYNIVSLKVEAGMDDQGKPLVTRLTLELLPHEVIMELDPALQQEVQDGLFGTR